MGSHFFSRKFYNGCNEEKGLIMNKAFEKIKQAWEENPIAVIIVASFAATAAAKLIDASTARANAQSWRTEVNRRDRMTR